MAVGPKRLISRCMGARILLSGALFLFLCLTEHRFRHLPVPQDDTAVGVVSIGGLVTWVIAGQAPTIHELEGYMTGAYPR